MFLSYEGKKFTRRIGTLCHFNSTCGKHKSIQVCSVLAKTQASHISSGHFLQKPFLKCEVDPLIVTLAYIFLVHFLLFNMHPKPGIHISPNQQHQDVLGPSDFKYSFLHSCVPILKLVITLDLKWQITNGGSWVFQPVFQESP